jgi:hypothetical protein
VLAGRIYFESALADLFEGLKRIAGSGENDDRRFLRADGLETDSERDEELDRDGGDQEARPGR